MSDWMDHAISENKLNAKAPERVEPTKEWLDVLIDGLEVRSFDPKYSSYAAGFKDGSQFLRDAILASQPERVECRLPHRKNAAGRLITGRWENAEGVNFCFGCGQSLKGAGDE